MPRATVRNQVTPPSFEFWHFITPLSFVPLRRTKNCFSSSSFFLSSLFPSFYFSFHSYEGGDTRRDIFLGLPENFFPFSRNCNNRGESGGYFIYVIFYVFMEEEILGIITLPFFYFFTFFLLKLKNSPPLPQLQQVTPPDTWLKIISIYGGKLMNEGIFFLKDLRPDFYSTLPTTYP